MALSRLLLSVYVFMMSTTFLNADEIRQWVDKEGNTHFGDSVAAENQDDSTLISGQSKLISTQPRAQKDHKLNQADTTHLTAELNHAVQLNVTEATSDTLSRDEICQDSIRLTKAELSRELADAKHELQQSVITKTEYRQIKYQLRKTRSQLLTVERCKKSDDTEFEFYSCLVRSKGLMSACQSLLQNNNLILVNQD